GVAARVGIRARGVVRHGRAGALRQPGHLAGPGAGAGPRRVGISRARRGGALVRGARRSRDDTGGDSMTRGGAAFRSSAAMAAVGLVALAAWGGGRTGAGTPPPRFGPV